jgi:hypothetical protein
MEIDQELPKRVTLSPFPAGKQMEVEEDVDRRVGSAHLGMQLRQLPPLGSKPWFS